MVSSTSDRTSRKGFKFTKGNKVDNNLDNSSYDDDNIDKTNVSDNSKNKRKLNSNNISTEKKSKSNQLNNSKSTIATSVIKKHRYPKSTYQNTSELSISSNSNADHSDIIYDLVKDITNNEKHYLKEYFESNETKSMKTSKHIHESTTDILDDLLTYLRGTNDQVLFEPELSRTELIRIQQLNQVKSILETHATKLNEYESDIALFAKEQDVWIGEKSIEDNINHNINEILSSNVNNNNIISETADEYLQLLQSIDKHCEKIILSTENTKHVIVEARQIQDNLYDNFNKVRMELVANQKVPSDAKDILKQMPNLF